MAQFEDRDGSLYIDGHAVIQGWESFSGWYWFAIEQMQIQDSVIDGKTYPNDTIWFGLVQGHEEEWGDFSQAELDSLKGKVWKIKRQDLPYAGRRG